MYKTRLQKKKLEEQLKEEEEQDDQFTAEELEALENQQPTPKDSEEEEEDDEVEVLENQQATPKDSEEEEEEDDEVEVLEEEELETLEDEQIFPKDSEEQKKDDDDNEERDKDEMIKKLRQDLSESQRQDQGCKIYHCHTIAQITCGRMSIAGQIPLKFLIPRSELHLEHFINEYEKIGYFVSTFFFNDNKNDKRICNLETCFYPEEKQIQTDLINKSKAEKTFISPQVYNEIFYLDHVNTITLNPKTCQRYFTLDLGVLDESINAQ